MKQLDKKSAYLLTHLLAPLLASILLAGCSPANNNTSALEKNWLQQNAQAFSGTDPAVDDFSDLRSFGDAIGDARIVALGEPSHGGGSVFDMKTRLVKYLHQEKGFDVLMIESGLFDVSRIAQLEQQGKQVDDLAPDVIFFMYSKSAQGRKVLRYVDQQHNTNSPLTLVGMDSRHSGKRSQEDLLPMLETFLLQRGSAIPTSAHWGTYKELTGLAVTMKSDRPDQSKLDAFDAVSANLEAELCAPQADSYAFPNSPGLWCRVVKSLHDQTDPQWGFKRNRSRDREMAANAEWLMEHPLAGRKVIIWAHSVHVVRSASGAAANMGDALNRRYGQQMYVVNFASSEGKYIDFENLNAADVAPDAENSLEAELHQMKQPYLFADARKNRPPPSAFTFHKEIDYQYFGPPMRPMQRILPAVLGWAGIPTFEIGSGYDGLFYIDKLEPATMNR